VIRRATPPEQRGRDRLAGRASAAERRRCGLSALALCAALGAAPAGSSAAAAAGPFLCTPQQSSGFHYDAGSSAWRPTSFTTSHQFLLRKLTAEDWQKYGGLFSQARGRPQWVFYSVGEETPLASCRGAEKSAPAFACDPIVADVAFDPKTGRFQVYHSGGFVMQAFWQRQPRSVRRQSAIDPKNPDDVVVEIGACKRAGHPHGR
jgi:hypothetical protein